MSTKTIQLTIKADMPLVARDVPTQRTVELVIQPPLPEQTVNRPRLNLALVLDRSGSMSGAKLQYVKEAALYLLGQIGEQDRLAVVAYDDTVTVVSESVALNVENRQKIAEGIRQLRTGGSTNLCEGWMTGCREVAAHHQEGYLQRTLLLTDGLANVGVTDQEELALHARELYSRGVSTSTFGVGEDFNEHLLEAMATPGGGNYHFIRSPHEIPELFAKEFSELATITLRDTEIILEEPAGVAVEVLGAWRVEQQQGQKRIILGALSASLVQPVYVTLLIPPMGENAEIMFKACVKGVTNENAVITAAAEVTFRAADSEALRTAPREVELLQRSLKVYLAQTANQSLKMERAGEREKAYEALHLALERSIPYMKADEIHYYRDLAQRLRYGMKEFDRKSTQFVMYQARRSRPEDAK